MAIINCVQLSQESSGNVISASDIGEFGYRRVTLEDGYINIHVYNVVFIVTTFLGFCISIMTWYWGENYCRGYSLNTVFTTINWHPLLMIVGFTFMYSQALLFYQTGRNLPQWCETFIPNSDIFWFTLIIKVICFIMVVMGLQVAFDYANHETPFKSHVYSLHSWLGIGSVILLCLDILVDFKWFFIDKISDLFRDVLVMISWMLGIMTFLMSVNTSIIGFLEDALRMYPENYCKLPPGAILLNIIGLFIAVFSAIVMDLNRKMREMGNLPPGDSEIVIYNFQEL